MIVPVRRLAALCVLGAVVTGCGTGHNSAPDPARQPADSASPGRTAAARPPTLAPGPGGLAPVFKHGSRATDGTTGRAGGSATDKTTGKAAGKTVALTFDADMTADQGPRAAKGERFDNPALLATLRRLKVPSTVFMTGRWAEQYPDQARSIGSDPMFEVANHSYSHYAFTSRCYGLPTVAPEKMRADVERAYAAFRKVGVKNAMPYFRFPGGCYDRTALRNVAQAGVTAVQWDVVSGDAFATDADAVAEEVLRGVRPGSVVVMHCTRSAAPTTERAIRKVVPELRKRGYRFVRVSELIGAEGRG